MATWLCPKGNVSTTCFACCNNSPRIYVDAYIYNPIDDLHVHVYNRYIRRRRDSRDASVHSRQRKHHLLYIILTSLTKSEREREKPKCLSYLMYNV